MLAVLDSSTCLALFKQGGSGNEHKDYFRSSYTKSLLVNLRTLTLSADTCPFCIAGMYGFKEAEKCDKETWHEQPDSTDA